MKNRILRSLEGLTERVDAIVFKPIRWVLTPFSDFWLTIVQWNETAVHAGTTLVLFAVIRGLFVVLDIHAPSLWAELLIDFAIACASFFLIRQFTVFSLGSPVGHLISIGVRAEGSARRAILTFAEDNLKKMREIIDGLRSQGGMKTESADVSFWVQQCFRFGSGRYDGTESHVPTEFPSVYPDYLRLHRDYLNVNPRVRRGTRILVTTREELTEDERRNSDRFWEFVRWHRETGVSLLWIERAQAKAQAARWNLPTTDVGLWHGQYALLFRPNGRTVTLNWFLDAEDAYRSTVSYFQALSDYARPIEDIGLFDEPLARAWADFVLPDERLKKEAPFLHSVLAEVFGEDRRGRILDAAAGIGTESTFLAKAGFDVTSNEIEKTLSDIASHNAAAEGVPLQLSAYDWRNLPRHFPAVFDVVLVLGNSVCLMLNRSAREQCLQAIAAVMKPGGRLVIDQRNFDKIRSNKEKILTNPPANFHAGVYSGQFMYCGRSVQACPVEFDDPKSQVVFWYYRNAQDVRDLEDAESNLVGKLVMHMFSTGELESLLRNTGFKDVTCYSDFTKGADASADFYTFVATKG